VILVVVGVIVGFILTDKILEKRGYRAKDRIAGVGIDELDKFLREKYLVNVAVIRDNYKKCWV